jgi:AraC-like DNA-binding protein
VKTIPHYTVSVNPLRLLAAVLRARGLPVADALARNGIAPHVIEDVDGRVPIRAACELWEDAAIRLDEPNIGLVVGEGAPIGDGVVAYALQTCATLGEAWRLVIRFHRLLTDAFEPRLVEEGDRARLTLYTPVVDWRLLRHLSDLYLAKFLYSGRALTGVDWSPIVVRFRYPRPPRVKEHRRFFRAPLVFGHAVDELEIEREMLELPLRGAEQRLLRLLDHYACDALSRLPPTSDFVLAVRFAVATALRHRQPTLDVIAARFHTSPRTLQRRLANNGLSLQRLVDDARHELALRFLERAELGIGEVGLLLGFDNKQSFYRAFRRWTAGTPAEFRRRLKQEAAPAQR